MLALGRRFCAVSYLVKVITGKGAENWLDYRELIASFAHMTNDVEENVCTSLADYLFPIVARTVERETSCALTFGQWRQLPPEVKMIVLQLSLPEDAHSQRGLSGRMESHSGRNDTPPSGFQT